jgi:hypothetical protein
MTHNETQENARNRIVEIDAQVTALVCERAQIQAMLGGRIVRQPHVSHAGVFETRPPDSVLLTCGLAVTCAPSPLLG